MIVTLALAALADAPGLADVPRHADATLFVLAFVGLIIGRRLSPRRATRPNEDGE